MYHALSTIESQIANKVNLFVALGPVMKITHCKSSLLKLVALNEKLLVDTCDLLGIYEFFPANWLTTGAMRAICGHLMALCELGDYLVADEDVTLDNEKRLQVYLGHFPSGTSLRSLDHYGQILNHDKFANYDFGKSGNKARYGTDTAPEINLQAISKVPIAMFVGTSDELATVEDNRWAKPQLKTLVHYKEYPLGHLSFMVAKDMSYFNDVLTLIKKYNPLLGEGLFLENTNEEETSSETDIETLEFVQE
jgi:hypothetical protein